MRAASWLSLFVEPRGMAAGLTYPGRTLMRARGPHPAIGLFAHLTWHTKHREATIRGHHLSVLGSALIAAAERTRVRIHALAMLADYVHIVASYSPDATLSAFVREAKSESARRAGILLVQGLLRKLDWIEPGRGREA